MISGRPLPLSDGVSPWEREKAGLMSFKGVFISDGLSFHDQRKLTLL